MAGKRDNHTTQTDLRLATLNLWGRRGDWRRRRDALRTGFNELAPDLLAAQEVVQTADYDQLRDILGNDLEIQHHSERETGNPPDVERGQGISIASRWPVDAVHEVDLTARTSDFACSTLIAEIDAPPPIGPLLFVNHLPSWQLAYEHERELQAVAAATELERLVAHADRHVIIAGDFDAEPTAASVRFWTGRQSLAGLSVCYRDTWESMHPDEPGDTFSAANPLRADPDWPFRRIDYILIRCGQHGGPTLQVEHCERIFDQPIDGTSISDHYGLLADLHASPAPA